MRVWPLLFVPLLALAAPAQKDSAAKKETGTVTGHVYCADSNAPARLASVQLESTKDAEQRTADHPNHSHGVPAGGVVQTGLDGSFTLSNVPPGSYYVVVTQDGYLSPRAQGEDFDDAQPVAPPGQPPVVIPKVEVEADQTADVEVRLERGAAVSGIVRFDDGSPASGARVILLHKVKDKWVSPTSTGKRLATTDDLGHYRVNGLRNREYLVKVETSPDDMVSLGTFASAYSGDTSRVRDAAPFQLGAGEERSGEDVTIPLSKLHSIVGVVTAARDGHTVTAGTVSIVSPEDKEDVARAEVGSDGAFRIDGVPEGTYLLHVQNPRDQVMQATTTVEGQGDVTFLHNETLHQYGDLEQSLKVEADIPNLVLAVPEAKNVAPTASQ